MPVTENLKTYAEDKVNKACSHFEGGIKEVDVRMSVAGGDRGTGAKQQKTEITVYTLSNGVVRAEDVEESMYASIDLVSDKLARKLRKMKEKAIASGSWHSSGRPLSAKPMRREIDSSTDEQELFPTDGPSDGPEIVRTKYFMLDPMTPREAVELVEQLGHPFFLFRDKDTNEVQVIYKRQTHGYGLIIPSNEE